MAAPEAATEPAPFLLRLRTGNPSAAAVAATAPWSRIAWQKPVKAPTVTIAEESMLAAIFAERPRPAALILMDAVRQPDDLTQRLGCPVVTMDAPLPGATFLWTPVPPMPPGPWRAAHRCALALFPARIAHYGVRQQAAVWLAQAGVSIRPRDDAGSSVAEYHAALRQAVAVVNMAADRKTGRWQMKGRVIEAGMAGCVLLEQRNPVTALRLTEGRDYLAWDTPGELSALIEVVRRGDGEAMARRLHRKVTTELTAAAFWSRVAGIAENQKS